MAQLLVRGLAEDIKEKLQDRARRKGRSTVEEVREILRCAVRDEEAPQKLLGSRIAGRFRTLGLSEEIAELRGEEAKPANLDS